MNGNPEEVQSGFPDDCIPVIAFQTNHYNLDSWFRPGQLYQTDFWNSITHTKMKSSLESFHVSALDDAESSSTYGGFFMLPALAGAYVGLVLRETVNNPKGVVEGFLDAFH